MKINMKPDKNEKELLDSFERGEWKSVPNLAGVKKHFQEAARETLRKDRRINIRLSQKDLEGMQTRAAREGMPYPDPYCKRHSQVCRGRPERGLNEHA